MGNIVKHFEWPLVRIACINALHSPLFTTHFGFTLLLPQLALHQEMSAGASYSVSQESMKWKESCGRLTDSPDDGFIPDSRSLPREVPWNDSDSASLTYDDVEMGPGETLPLMKEEAPEAEAPEDNPMIFDSDVIPSSNAGQVF